MPGKFIVSFMAVLAFAFVLTGFSPPAAMAEQDAVQEEKLDAEAIRQRIGKAGKLREDGEFAEALKYVLPLAQRGDPVAQYQTGLIYDRDGAEAMGSGQGELGTAEHDFEQAKHWYGEAAKNGYLKGQVGLGNLYIWGVSGMRAEGLDEPRGRQLLLDAADKGEPDAMRSIGDLYGQGFGGFSHDRGIAAEWYKKAALLGDKSVLSLIGLFYKEGYLNAKQDQVEAYFWLCLAGKLWCEGIERELTPVQLAEVRRRTEEWRARYPDF